MEIRGRQGRRRMRKCGCHSHNGFVLGSERTAQREIFRRGVDNVEMFGYLDKVGSVSALVEGEEFHVFDDQLLENQLARHLYNG